MLLIHEDLARAHTEQRIADAVRTERLRRLSSAARAARKAERAHREAAQMLSLVTVSSA